MPYAEVNGQTLYYEDTGGAGLPVILGHGFLMDCEMFAPQVEALRDEFRVITWDERGFGKTESDGRPFSYWDGALDCLALLDHLGIARAVVGGMSQGGYLSLRLALLAPERVIGLVLIDTAAGDEGLRKTLQYRLMLAAWSRGWLREPLMQRTAKIIIDHEPENAEWIAKWRARDGASIVEPGRCLMSRDSVSPRLHEISCPALVIHGTDDHAISLEHARALAGGLRGCQGVVEIEGAGHAANLTHPAPVNAALLSFLRGLPQA